MAVEDHPKFPEWRAALDLLTEAKEAFSSGKATQAEVDKAQAQYDRISGELDA
jgi:outer membrane protein TolC